MGTVVTFLDRDRRIVSGTVTELRRLEIVVTDAETGPSRVRYARLPLIKAGFTRGATMQQVAHHAARLLERHLHTGAPANRWRFRFETATGRARICPYPATTIALLVSYVLRAPCDDIPDTLPHEIAHAIAGPRPLTRRRVASSRAANRQHREPLQRRHARPEAVDR